MSHSRRPWGIIAQWRHTAAEATSTILPQRERSRRVENPCMVRRDEVRIPAGTFEKGKQLGHMRWSFLLAELLSRY